MSPTEAHARGLDLEGIAASAITVGALAWGRTAIWFFLHGYRASVVEPHPVFGCDPSPIGVDEQEPLAGSSCGCELLLGVGVVRLC